MLEGDFTGRPVQRDAQDGVQASDEDGHPLGRGHRLGRGFEDATLFGLRRHGEIGGGTTHIKLLLIVSKLLSSNM